MPMNSSNLGLVGNLRGEYGMRNHKLLLKDIVQVVAALNSCWMIAFWSKVFGICRGLLAFVNIEWTHNRCKDDKLEFQSELTDEIYHLEGENLTQIERLHLLVSPLQQAAASWKDNANGSIGANRLNDSLLSLTNHDNWITFIFWSHWVQ